jgi:3-isopropylmalate/(R)-2-methylmalate dehydratase small subunit
MQAFTVLRGIAAPLPLSHVDTDAILPARFLKGLSRSGLGDKLFHDLRFDDLGRERADFVLNREPFRSACILIAHEDFGVGSSREHAPWALLDFGVRSVIAPSFADIFEENCMRNGLLPVRLPRAICDALMEDAAATGAELVVDLQHQEVVRPGGQTLPFAIDLVRRERLLQGLDEIALTLSRAAAIDAFEQQRAAAQPWTSSYDLQVSAP